MLGRVPFVTSRIPMNKWLILLLLVPFIVQAAPASKRQKAGLWDLTVTLEAPEEAAGLLEQLKGMGLELPEAQPSLYQVCLTPEQAALDRIPTGFDPDSGCRVQNSRRDGNRLTADAVCDGGMQGRGSVDAVLHTPESFSGKLKFRGSTADGIPLDTNGSVVGRWQGADCRGVESYDF